MLFIPICENDGSICCEPNCLSLNIFRMADHDDSTCSSGGSVEVVNPETSEMTDAELPVGVLVNNGLPVMVNGDMCTDGPVESVEQFDGG